MPRKIAATTEQTTKPATAEPTTMEMALAKAGVIPATAEPTAAAATPEPVPTPAPKTSTRRISPAPTPDEPAPVPAAPKPSVETLEKMWKDAQAVAERLLEEKEKMAWKVTEWAKEAQEELKEIDTLTSNLRAAAALGVIAFDDGFTAPIRAEAVAMMDLAAEDAAKAKESLAEIRAKFVAAGLVAAPTPTPASKTNAQIKKLSYPHPATVVWASHQPVAALKAAAGYVDFERNLKDLVGGKILTDASHKEAATKLLARLNAA